MLYIHLYILVYTLVYICIYLYIHLYTFVYACIYSCICLYILCICLLFLCICIVISIAFIRLPFQTPLACFHVFDTWQCDRLLFWICEAKCYGLMPFFTPKISLLVVLSVWRKSSCFYATLLYIKIDDKVVNKLYRFDSLETLDFVAIYVQNCDFFRTWIGIQYVVYL